MLTQEEFGKHVGSQFSTSLGEREIDLTLVEVKGYLAGATEEKGMERFSVFFDGPPDFTLPQQSFHLHHDQMGEFDIFLVAISGSKKGLQYEAVFNYYRDSTER